MPLRIDVAPRTVFRILLSIVGFFVVAHIVSQFVLVTFRPSWGWELLTRFDLEQEVSVPTWFSHSNLLFAAVILAVIACDRRRNVAGDRRYWTGLSIIFLYLSIDEGASLHELAAKPVREALHITNSFLVLSWILPAALLVTIFGLTYLRFWWRLPPPVRLRFAAGAVTYVGGAVIVEALSSAYVARFGYTKYGLPLMRVAEEGLEMTGICIFIYGLLLYASEHVSCVELSVHSGTS